MRKLLLTTTLSFITFALIAQQNVFHRSDADTDNWWDDNDPWFYENLDENHDRPDKDWRTANHVFFGHNNNLNMNVNGSDWYYIKTLTFQSSNDETRTLTETEGAGIDLRGNDPRKIENLSSAEHILDLGVALHDDFAEFNPINGDLTFKREIITNSLEIRVWGDNGHTLTIEGNIQGTGGLTVKQNSRVLLIGDKTYTGGTFVEAGTLEIQGSLESSGITVEDGATLRVSNGNSKNDEITINDLTVNSGGTVEVEADVNLTINGTLTNEGTVIIQSSPTSTGSLIHNTNNVQATVERFIQAAPNWPENVGDKNENARGWHFLSSPVDGQSIDDDWTPTGSGNDYDFYAWDEGGTWLNQKQGHGITEFNQGQGYLVAYQQEDTKAFEGTMNNGTITVNLEHNGNNNGKDWTYQPGWNLLGNPYPSAIDWNEAVRTAFANNIAHIYDRNQGGGGDYIEVDGSAANAIIPAHQGFFVLADADPGEFTFTNDMRVHGDNFMKDQPASEHIRLRITKNDFYSDTRIRIHKDAQHGTDRYDAHKLFSLNPNMPQVFTHTEDHTRVAINSIPHINKEQPITLGMRIPEDGEYTLSLQEISGAFENNILLLEDAHKDIIYDLHAQPVYAFEAEEGMISERFTLHFSPPDDDTTDIPGTDAPEARIWHHDNTLYVDNPGEQAEIRLYDISGRLMQTIQADTGQQSHELNLPAGAYIIQSNHQDIKPIKIIIH